MKNVFIYVIIPSNKIKKLMIKEKTNKKINLLGEKNTYRQ